MEELNSKDFISKNEKEMKYEVEEMDNLQKKLARIILIYLYQNKKKILKR